MKVVGFNTKEGLHLGVVEGQEVIDLQTVDASAPNDLGEWLRRDNGDLTSLKALAQRARFNARRPLGGLDYTLPVARPGKIICLVPDVSGVVHSKCGHACEPLSDIS